MLRKHVGNRKRVGNATLIAVIESAIESIAEECGVEIPAGKRIRVELFLEDEDWPTTHTERP